MYVLQPYDGPSTRHVCPRCGDKKSFTLYIDESGNKIQRVQRISIHPLCGRGVIAWGNNAKNNPNDVTFEERACLTALIYGADISEEDAIRLMDCDRTTANAISLAVWVATTRFYKAKREEAETAEKNSGTAGTNTGN